MDSIKLTNVLVQSKGELVVRGEFKKRDLIVKESIDKYPQTFAVEFPKEKEAELDFVEAGETVTIECNLRGREWIGTDGVAKYFITLQAWRITKVNP